MCLNFIILCILLVTQAFGAPISNTYSQLKLVSKQKCPFMGNSIFLEPEQDFLKKCDVVNASLLNLNVLSTENEEPVLCFVYLSVFDRLCESVGQNSYDILRLTKAINETLQKRTITDVCSSLGNITESVLKHTFISSALHSPQDCNRLCTDYGQLRSICTWTSFMWSFSDALETDRKLQIQKKPIVSQHSKSKGAIDKQKTSGAVAGTSLLESSTTTSNLEANKNEIEPNLINSDSLKTPPKTSNDVKGIPNNGIQLTSNNPAEDTKNSPVGGLPQDKLNVLPKSEDPLIKQQTQKTFENTMNKSFPNSNIPTGTAPKQLDNTLETGNKKNLQVAEDLPAKHSSTTLDNHQLLPHPLDENHKKGDVESETKNTQLKNAVKEKEPVKESNDVKNPVIEVPKLDVDYNVDEDNDFENLNDVPKEAKDKPIDKKITLPDKNIFGNEPAPKSSEVKQKPVEVSKPREIDEDSSNLAANFQNQSIDDSDSYFFSYFMMVCVMFICGYVAYHNKQKILALVLEGRKGRRPSRSRRPNSANYRKLDTTLEEAVTSSCNKNTTQVIY